MSRVLLAPALGASLLAGAAQARLSSLSNLFVFGDSLSDNGNSGVISTNAESVPPIFPPPPYSEARFSNGPVAAEVLWRAFNPSAPPLRASLLGGTNFAVGGATTGVENYIQYSAFNISPTLKNAYAGTGNAWQLDRFAGTSFDPTTSLFLVWLFPNDPFTVFDTGGLGVGRFDGQASPPGPAAIVPTAVANIIGTIKELAAQGARHFLVPNSADLGLIPEFYGTSLEDSFSFLSQQFNANLASSLDLLRLTNPEVDIVEFAIDEVFAEVRANPSAYGFDETKLSTGCVSTPECVFGSEALQDTFLFWDNSHPTAAGHALIGQRFYEATRASVPAPLPIAGAIASLAWSRKLRGRVKLRRQKTNHNCATRYQED